MLLVAADGSILAANRTFAERLEWRQEELLGRRLAELVTDSPQSVADYLRACSRSKQLLPGSLTLSRKSGPPLACRCEGGLYQPRSEGNPPEVLLRFVEKEAA